MASFYVTTAIPYVNAAPHLGFALELVQADVLARYHRSRAGPPGLCRRRAPGGGGRAAPILLLTKRRFGPVLRLAPVTLLTISTSGHSWRKPLTLQKPRASSKKDCNSTFGTEDSQHQRPPAGRPPPRGPRPRDITF